MKLILALAAAGIALAPMPPFPAPKLTGVTPDTKCDWGPITEVKSDRTLVVRTDAGPFEVTLGPAVKVAGADGRPLASATLAAGQNVRVYYLVSHGAKAQEVDVLP
jgi:hypothetical protein